ncbi:diguanylate cyclase [Thiovibrio sp. JS02]
MQTGLLLCDRECRAVFANQVAMALFRQAGIEVAGQPCHKLLLGNDGACAGCPAREGEEAGKKHSLVLKGRDGDIYLKVICQFLQGQFLLTIHDVTQEITLLRRTDLDRKELQAKNILLEHRRRLNMEEQEFLAQLMNNLPDALLTVDENFLVQRKNSAVRGMFADETDTHCYTLLGFVEPCPACPARQGFAAADGLKRSHEAAGRFFTEIFSVAPNGRGGLLIFRDITRQVGLIEQIRSNQEEIARKNKILSLLVDFGTYLQKENDVKEVVDYFLDTVLPTLHDGAVALVVNDVRAGNLWLTQQRGLQGEEFKALSKACLARDLQTGKSEGLISASLLPWPKSQQIPLIGAKGQRVGLVVLEGKPGVEELAFLRLVTEPLGAYFQNQLLLRQLEERANKDALTGLFNRGYLTQAIDEEMVKFERYGIHYAVVLADINGLKKLNDLHGHDCGDQLIVVAAMALQKTLRSSDIAARTGGDEFVILLTNTTDEEADHFVRRLQSRVFADLTLSLQDGSSFPVTVSLGKAGTDKCPPEALLKEADREMYAAKQKFYQSAPRYR